jgi:hypothetical protein
MLFLAFATHVRFLFAFSLQNSSPSRSRTEEIKVAVAFGDCLSTHLLFPLLLRVRLRWIKRQHCRVEFNNKISTSIINLSEWKRRRGSVCVIRWWGPSRNFLCLTIRVYSKDDEEVANVLLLAVIYVIRNAILNTTINF